MKDRYGELQTQSVPGGTISQTTILNLMSFTVYSVQVAAMTGAANIGLYSNVIKAETRGMTS